VVALSEFMDAQLGGRPGPSLVASGPASDRLSQAVRRETGAESVLASLFWWCYVRTDEYSPPDSHGHRIVVSHANGTRHDLLELTSTNREPLVLRMNSGLGIRQYRSPSGRERGIASVALSEGQRLRGRLARAGITVDARTVTLAITEVARRADFGIVVASEPGEMPTATTTSAAAPVPAARPVIAPAPALPVCLPGDLRPIATAGVIGTLAEGRLLAVTARHAVADALHLLGKDPRLLGMPPPASHRLEPASPRQATSSPRRGLAYSRPRVHLVVSGSRATVVDSDAVTDSCLLALARQTASAAWSGAGLAGPLKIAPAEHRPATFDGAASGHKQTMIRGYDLSVLDPSPYLSSKVYTDPDTIPGDSGAALIDSDDHIVGFACSRSAFGSPFEFSTWSWADQVLAWHGLA
jgi:hypothetical protein